MNIMHSGIDRVVTLLQAMCLTALLVWRPGLAQEADDGGYLPVQTSINALMVALVDHAAHEIWEAGAAETLSPIEDEMALLEQYKNVLRGSSSALTSEVTQ